jgi:hypothetical protein
LTQPSSLSFDFRGQLSVAGSTVLVTVQDNQDDPAQMFDFNGLSADRSERFDGVQGVEAFEFDPAAIPETSTWAMMTLGFAGLGFAGYRKAKTSRAALSAV